MDVGKEEINSGDRLECRPGALGFLTVVLPFAERPNLTTSFRCKIEGRYR